MVEKGAVVRFVASLLGWILLSSSAIAQFQSLSTDYSGPDAGYAVIGIGATSTTENTRYTFYFRRIRETTIGRLTYEQNLLFSRTPDYKTEEENGIVEIASLPAGHYEVIKLSTSRSRASWSSRKEFSIPFEVRPGEVVYLGNYQAHGLRGKNVFGWTVPAGAFFVVEDRFRIDLELAKARVPSLSLGDARNATPDVQKVGNPLLVSREQVRRASESRKPVAPSLTSDADQEATVTEGPPGQEGVEK